jgi:hypothetical protein
MDEYGVPREPQYEQIRGIIYRHASNRATDHNERTSKTFEAFYANTRDFPTLVVRIVNGERWMPGCQCIMTAYECNDESHVWRTALTKLDEWIESLSIEEREDASRNRYLEELPF